MYEYLNYTKEDGVALIQFNRPQQLNAMNRDFMDEIVTSLESANADDEVKVIIITGSGRAFMSGSDIKKYAAQTDEEFDSFQKRGKDIYFNCERNKKPVIAAVNGYALGGGFEICLSCDLIVASKSASFGLPEVNIGLVPGGGGTQRLITRVGITRAKEMLMFGGRYPADKLLDWGVVNYVVEDDELIPYAKEIAAKLCRRSAAALTELKRLALLSSLPVDRDERLDNEIATLYRLFHTPEAKELINNFANKSKKK